MKKKRIAMNVLKMLGIFLLFSFISILIANQPITHVLAENHTNDTTPPVTEISFTSEEWQNSPISITLTCTDDVACDMTFYCKDASNSCDPNIEYSTPFGHSDEGESYIRFYSIDTSNNIENTISQILKIDMTLPSVTIISPSEGQQIEGGTFTITGTSADSISGIEKVEVVINGQAGDAIGKENWQYQWENIVDGTYTIVSNAIDNAGNVKNETVNVIVDNLPSARIVFGDPPFVRAGKIQIELLTSEPVQPRPTLSYSFPGQGSIQIPLDGSSQTWTGIMIITEGDNDKIGSFAFSAIDLSGHIGNLITQGNWFIVDAVKPEQVLNLDSEVEGSEVRLTWFYEGEELENFNIYRDTKSDVNYADYYKSVPSDTSSTIDEVDSDEKYYYRVAAVDPAGNVGPLSEVVSASGGEVEENQQENTNTQTQTNTNTPTIPVQVLQSINSAIAKVDGEIIEVEKAKVILERNSASKELGLILQLNNAKATFNGFKEDLEKLKSGTRSRTDIENEIQRINLKVKAIKKDLPKEISLETEDSFIQETSFKDIENIAELLTYELTPRERDRYIIQNQRLQSRIEVKVTSTFFKITLFGGEREVTLIKKEISSSVENASIVEVIPKTVAASTKEVTFITEGYEVLEEDPVVRWNKDIDKIEYHVDKKLSQAESRQVKTLVLSDGIGSYGFITGLSVFGRSAVSVVANAKMLVGLIILTFLVVFYFVYLRNGNGNERNGINGIGRRNGYGYPKDLAYDYMKRKYSSHYKRDYRIDKGKNEGVIRGMFDKYVKPLNAPQKRQLQSIALTDTEKHFHEIVETSNFYIDNGKFSLASKSYSLLVELYKILDTGNKRISYNKVLCVYNKLNLYSKIKELHVAEKANLGMNLRNLLEHVAELYSVISKTEKKDTKLLRFARGYYDYAISRLRR